jgi:hypothetical protein
MTVGPNPATSSVRLAVRLAPAGAGPVRLTIYDAAGRAIRELGPSRPGVESARFEWDLRDGTGRPVPPGLYFAQARSGASHEERTIVVAR